MWAKISRFYPPWLELIPVLLLGFAFAYTAMHYAALPEQMPTHFGISGQPDDWSTRGFVSVYLPLVIGLLVWLSMILINYFSIIKPEDPGKYINLPKQQKEKMGPEQMEAIRTVNARGMIVINITVTAMITVIQYGAINAALGIWKGLGWGVGILAAILVAESIWLAIKSISMSFTSNTHR